VFPTWDDGRARVFWPRNWRSGQAFFLNNDILQQLSCSSYLGYFGLALSNITCVLCTMFTATTPARVPCASALTCSDSAPPEPAFLNAPHAFGLQCLSVFDIFVPTFTPVARDASSGDMAVCINLRPTALGQVLYNRVRTNIFIALPRVAQSACFILAHYISSPLFASPGPRGAGQEIWTAQQSSTVQHQHQHQPHRTIH
jgi:hypothetical protein